MISNQILITVLVALLLHSEMITLFAEPIYGIIGSFIQNNIAGIPSTHQTTKWDFDPNASKQWRLVYEEENGRLGKSIIAKLGMGPEYNVI